MRLLALDLHQDNLVAAIQDLSEGKPTMCIRKVAFAPQPLAAFLEQLGPDDFVVMESTMNAFWLAGPPDRPAGGRLQGTGHQRGAPAGE